MSDKKIYFVTFGASSQDFHDAADRICNQAYDFNIFYKIYCFNENRLKEDDLFWGKHSEFILNNKRGYGYYIWKPYIILEILKTINNNDILLWCDCGCDLNIDGKDNLLKLLDKLDVKNILGTNGTSTDIKYTKMDIIKFFNYNINDINDINILNIPQMQSGCLLIKKCDRNMFK